MKENRAEIEDREDKGQDRETGKESAVWTCKSALIEAGVAGEFYGIEQEIPRFSGKSGHKSGHRVPIPKFLN